MSWKKTVRTIVIGDIHGCYDELVDLLDVVAYNPKADKIIFLGDYIDRGRDSDKVVALLRQMQKENKKCICLCGNHEDMAIDSFRYSDYHAWNRNGGNATRKSYYRSNRFSHIQSDIEWFKTLPLYHMDKDGFYVHAGFNFDKRLSEQTSTDLLWIRETFYCRKSPWKKPITFGHSMTQTINGGDLPVRVNGHYALDTGCVSGGCLTAMIIEDGRRTFYGVDKIDGKHGRGSEDYAAMGFEGGIYGYDDDDGFDMGDCEYDGASSAAFQAYLDRAVQSVNSTNNFLTDDVYGLTTTE